MPGMAYTLYIGEKRYSSWSLRGWLALRGANIPFQEVLLSFAPDPGRAARFARLPAGRVPVLDDGGVAVWDSLAIGEYLAERHPGLWPEDRVARAWARSICAEMHSGFQALRNGMSMDVVSRRPQRKRTPAVLADIDRIVKIWNETRSRFGQGGPLLFGRFTLADAYYAPVAYRFRTYGVSAPGAAGEYARAVLALPALAEWEAAAAKEPVLEDHDLDRLYPEDGPAPRSSA
jgi:glutathione S-transferase